MLRFHATDDRVLAVRIPGDGLRFAVASGTEDQWAQLSYWDPKTAIRVIHRRLPERVIAISNDWSLIAIRNRNNFLTILDTATLQSRFPALRLRFGFDDAFFQPNSTRMLTIGRARYSPFQRYRIAYDFEEGTEYIGDCEDYLRGFSAFSPDGRLVAVDSRDAIEVREWETDRRIVAFPTGPGPRTTAFGPDGTTVISLQEDFVQVWDVPTGVQRFSMVGHRGMVLCAMFSPDEKWIATGGVDRQVRIWDAVTGSPHATYDWEIGPVRALAFAPDGLTCAAGGDSGDVVIWDV